MDRGPRPRIWSGWRHGWLSGLAAAGLEEGDRVAFLLPNCLEAIVCYLACFRMRFVVVPLDYQYHPLQVGYALGHSRASILIADHGRIAGLEEAGALGAVSRVFVVRGGAADGKRRSFESLLGGADARKHRGAGDDELTTPRRPASRCGRRLTWPPYLHSRHVSA